MFGADPHPVRDGNEVRGVIWGGPCWGNEGWRRERASEVWRGLEVD